MQQITDEEIARRLAVAMQILEDAAKCGKIQAGAAQPQHPKIDAFFT